MKNDISVDEFLLFAKMCIGKPFTTIRNKQFKIESVDKGIKIIKSGEDRSKNNISPSNLQYYLKQISSSNRYKTTTYSNAQRGSTSYFVTILKEFDKKCLIEYLIEYPDEFANNYTFIEGGLTKISVNKYKRNQTARDKCLEKHGYNCSVCDINFERKYGEIGRNFIHVHHLIEISSIGKEYEIHPSDLRPVCPNCHVMLHTKKPAITIDELKEIRSQLKNNT